MAEVFKLSKTRAAFINSLEWLFSNPHRSRQYSSNVRNDEAAPES